MRLPRPESAHAAIDLFARLVGEITSEVGIPTIYDLAIPERIRVKLDREQLLYVPQLTAYERDRLAKELRLPPSWIAKIEQALEEWQLSFNDAPQRD